MVYGSLLIKKGAEAYLYKEVWYGLTVVRKHRVRKLHRNQELDLAVRRHRTVHEARLLTDARLIGVSTPIVYEVYVPEATIVMEYIEGDVVKDIFDMLDPDSRRALCAMVGRLVGRLHADGLIHGDLTTSNMILSSGKLYFIDFGLGEYSREPELMGIDLHLMLRALESTHYRHAEEGFKAVLEGYGEVMGLGAVKVIEKIREIRRRGRYVSERRLRPY